MSALQPLISEVHNPLHGRSLGGLHEETVVRRISLWLPLAMWTLLLAGMLLQLFSPHLQIAHDSFIIPPDIAHPGSTLDPRALVQKERVIQSSSALLVLAGAIGLALYHRCTLLRYITGKGEN